MNEQIGTFVVLAFRGLDIKPHYYEHVKRIAIKNGSERESVRAVILRGFPHRLKSDIFSIGCGHPFDFQK